MILFGMRGGDHEKGIGNSRLCLNSSRDGRSSSGQAEVNRERSKSARNHTPYLLGLATNFKKSHIVHTTENRLNPVPFKTDPFFAQAVRNRSRAGEVGSQEGASRGADIVECSVAVHCDAVAGTVIS